MPGGTDFITWPAARVSAPRLARLKCLKAAGRGRRLGSGAALADPTFITQLLPFVNWPPPKQRSDRISRVVFSIHRNRDALAKEQGSPMSLLKPVRSIRWAGGPVLARSTRLMRSAGL
jgi:hypothetical protein